MPEETPRQVPDLGPRSVGRILDRAFDLYRANFRTVAGSAMIVVFVIALIAGVAQTFYARGAMVLVGDIFSQTAMEPDLEAFTQAQMWGWLTNLMALPLWIARLYIEACIYAAAVPMLYGERFTIREFLRGGRGRYLWYVLVSFLLSMITGFYFLIVPLIFVAGWALAPLIVVVENASFDSVFRRSWTLTKGSKWRVIGFFIVLGAFTLVLQTAVTSPTLIRQLVASIQNPEAVFQPLSVGWKVLEGLLTAAAITLVAPFASFAWLSFYLDLRARREGMDIVAAAAQAKERA